jgi:hypothetical protein
MSDNTCIYRYMNDIECVPVELSKQQKQRQAARVGRGRRGEDHYFTKTYSVHNGIIQKGLGFRIFSIPALFSRLPSQAKIQVSRQFKRRVDALLTIQTLSRNAPGLSKSIPPALALRCRAFGQARAIAQLSSRSANS